MKKGVKLGAQNLLLLNLIKLFFMSVIIICLICAALVFGVEYFGRRHMRLFKLKAESQGGENIVSAVDQVYYGGKKSDKSEAERLRTRKIKYVLWVLIVFFGAASIVFVSFKDQWLGEWKTENKVETRATVSGAETPLFSVVDYLAIYFSNEKALRYYGTKRRVAYEKASAEYQKYEQELKRAQEKQDEVEIIIQNEKLAEAKAKLDSAEKNWKNFKFIPQNWRINTNLNWLLLFLLVVSVWNVYYIYMSEHENSGLLVATTIVSFFAFALGLIIPFAVFVRGYQEECLFTLRDVVGIILTIWCVISFKKMSDSKIE